MTTHKPRGTLTDGTQVRTAIEEQKEQDRKDAINFSKRVKKRYGRRCEFCGRTEDPRSHHVIPRQYRNRGYPGDIDDVINGTVLCNAFHHPMADNLSGTHDNSGKDFSEYTGPKTREELWERLKEYEQRNHTSLVPDVTSPVA